MTQGRTSPVRKAKSKRKHVSGEKVAVFFIFSIPLITFNGKLIFPTEFSGFDATTCMALHKAQVLSSLQFSSFIRDE